jgi:FixJ family two-component response regulator
LEENVQVVSIIDDDQSVRYVTQSLIRSLGLAAQTFASAEEFLRSPYLSTTACLISDVQMPGMSGVELQAKLAAQGYSIPIIFITAFPSDALRSRVLSAGAVGFLHKPFDSQTLIDHLQRALGHVGRTAP